MKILISPAKTLDYDRALPTNTHTMPDFLTHSRKIQKALKRLKPADLSELMHISDKLAELNWKRNREWKTPFTPENARAAVYAFNGDVYQGLDAYTLSVEKMEALQDKLRILSGLYGLLKPLDLIMPYRLEMGTNLAVGEYKNLYEFWRPMLAKSLNKEMKKGEVLVNLASKEYFDAMDTKLLKARVITPEFRDYRNGKLAVIALFAKKARGMMVRYIAENNIENAEDLKGFHSEGYGFDERLSTEDKWVFTR